MMCQLTPTNTNNKTSNTPTTNMEMVPSSTATTSTPMRLSASSRAARTSRGLARRSMRKSIATPRRASSTTTAGGDSTVSSSFDFTVGSLTTTATSYYYDNDGQASGATTTTSTVEKPSFTSITTPELLFRVDSTDSVQSDSSTLVALRQKVKQLDGLLDDLQEKVLSDPDNFDEDGMVEELYSLEYSEKKLRQELNKVDVLLSPALSAEQRDANASTLLKSLQQCETPSGQEVIVFDGGDEERDSPPECCTNEACDMSSGLQCSYYTIGTHNLWSADFMEEEQEVELVFDKSPKAEEEQLQQIKKKEDQKDDSPVTLEIPYPLEFSGRPAEQETSFPMTPCSCYSTDTHESNIFRVADVHGGSTPRPATDRELKILAIPSLDEVEANNNHDAGFFCCMSTPHFAAFGCDEEHDLLLSPDEPQEEPKSEESSPLFGVSPTSTTTTHPFSPMCDLNKDRLSTISEGVSADLMSPQHRQWNLSGSNLGLVPSNDDGATENGSSIFAGINASRDDSTENNDVLSPSTNQSSQTRKVFNFEKKNKKTTKNDGAKSEKSPSKDARALRTPISMQEESGHQDSSSASSSSSSETDTVESQPQHVKEPTQQWQESTRAIENSLRYELQFGASADLLSSADVSTYQPERMPATLLANLKTKLEVAKSTSVQIKVPSGTKDTISSNSFPTSPIANRSPGAQPSPTSPRSPSRALKGRPPVSPKNRADILAPAKRSPMHKYSSTSPKEEMGDEFPADEQPLSHRHTVKPTFEPRPRKLCLEAESVYKADYGEIHTPHHASDAVSPLPSFRSITGRSEDEEDSIVTGTAMSKPIVIPTDVDYNFEYDPIEEAPTDEMQQSRCPSKSGKSAISVKIVNSYDDPMLVQKKSLKNDDDDEDDAIVETLARIYLRTQVGKFEEANDDPLMDIASIKESIHSGTFDEDYGGYGNDEDSIHDAVSRLAKRIQANKYTTKEDPSEENELANKSNAADSKHPNDDGRFYACFDSAIECVIGDDICYAQCDEPMPQPLEHDDFSLPSIMPSRTTQSSFFLEAEKSYLNDKDVVVSQQTANQDDADTTTSDNSPDLKLTESVDAHVACLSPKAPQLPLREELPTLGVELVYREKTDASCCSASVGDLSELKEKKRRIENDLQLERSSSYQERGPQRTMIQTSQTPRRHQKQFGRVLLRPDLDDSPTPRTRNKMEMTTPRIKNGDFITPRIKNTTQPRRRHNFDIPETKPTGSDDDNNKNNKTLTAAGFESESLASSAEMSKDEKQSGDIKTLLDCNEQLLQSIAKFNFSTYQSLVTDDLTGVDPGTNGQIRRRQAFHRYYLQNSHSTIVNISMVSPFVRFISDDTAIVTYIRLDQLLERDGTSKTKRTSETRVWEKRGGDKKTWRNCHFHQSVAS